MRLLEARLTDALMSALFPCDLGDGIEVLHDVEDIEIELECDLGDDAWDSTPYEKIEIHFESVAVPFEDLTARERVVLHELNLGGIERAGISDTLPFAPFDDLDVSVPFVTVVETVLAETVPYARV